MLNMRNLLLSLYWIVYSSFCESSIIIAAKSIDKQNIIIGSDTLQSNENVQHRNINKIIRLTNDRSIYLCNSLTYDINNHFQNLHANILDLMSENPHLSIESISKSIRQLINKKYYNNHILLVGRDDLNNSLHIYEVLPKGTLIEHDLFAVCGANSDIVTFLINEFYSNMKSNSQGASNESSYLNDNKFNNNKNFELIKRVQSALNHVIKTDQKSGGKVKLITI